MNTNKHENIKHTKITFITNLNSCSSFNIHRKIKDIIGINISLGIPIRGLIETSLFTISPEPTVKEA
tara:strand:+ start:7 stop:207 length:201 start_codon:yes stop_codon:yes gene_type:complete